MFDFRYHMVSLAAVFLALVIGILVGIGLSGKGFVDDAERENLQQEIASLRDQVSRLDESSQGATSRLLAIQDLVDEAYGPLVAGRLEQRQLALLFVGKIDEPIRQAVTDAVADAGGTVVKVRALRVPVDSVALAETLADKPQLVEYAAAGALPDIAAGLGTEFVTGGRSPLWTALAQTLVDEQKGPLQPPVDGVVVARTAKPQAGETMGFLASLYSAIARTGVPAVGVQEAGAGVSSVAPFASNGLSTVDSIDTVPGKLALVVLLAGGQRGDYGVEETAKDGIIPPLGDLAP